MKRSTIGIVAGLLAALFYLQFGVLERTEVQRLERESQNLGELSAPALLPTYIGSLFLGSFRAVAIDILWIQMNRMGEQEHRYFERVEVMDMITKLQPRNPEAWAHQGWDAAFNIANQFRTIEDVEKARELQAQIDAGGPGRDEKIARLDKLKRRIQEKDVQYRKWVQVGLLKIAEGCRHLPDDPYLKSEVGYTLWTKSAWSNGILEDQFLRAIEEDKELQARLGDGQPSARPRTSFELSEVWFHKGEETLRRQIKAGKFRVYRTLADSMSRPPEEDRQHHTTQMGRNFDIAAFTGFIHVVRYLNGIHKWYRARDETDPAIAKALLLEASESFAKAADQAALYRKLYSPTVAEKRAFHDARAELCRGMAQVCADQAKLPHPLTAADRAALLARLDPIRWGPVDRNAPLGEQMAPVDERYVLDYMGDLKRSLGGDGWEFNDDLHALHRGNFLMAGERADATIGPDLRDVDWYHYYAAPPGESGHDDHEHAPVEIRSVFQIARVGDLPLIVTVLASYKGKFGPVANFEITDAQVRQFPVISDREGQVCIFVSAKAPADAPAINSGYWIKALGDRP